MTPKEIFELETLEETHWPNTEAFWSFVYKEIDDELFNYEDAVDDTRISTQIKAFAEEKGFSQSYWAITFDGKLVGIIVLWGRVDESWCRYITNYPLYQAMVGYVKTMYTPTDSDEIVGEEEDIEDLEYQYGWVIDKTCPSNMRRKSK